MASKKINHQFLVNGYISDYTTGEDYDISDKFLEISIKKDYSTKIFPQYEVVLQVEETLRSVIKNDNVKIYVSIQQYSINEEDSEALDPVVESTVLSTTLRIFDHNLTELSNIETNEDETEDPVKNQLYKLRLDCIPDDLMEVNDVVFNDVFLNATIDDALVEVLGDCRNVYIDPSDNNYRYETLLIPPLNRSKAIEWINANYGIYESKYSLFFDTDATYLTRMYKHTEKSSINSFDITIAKADELNSNTGVGTIEMDDEGNMHQTLNIIPDVTSVADVISDTYGGTSVVGTYGSEYELSTRSYNNSDNEKVRYFWNNRKEPLFEASMLSAPTKMMPLILNAINPNLFSLKTAINLHCYDEAYTGRYDVVNIESKFTSINKKTFSCTSILMCAK